MASALEEEMAFQLHAAGVPDPEREFRFLRNRRFRFDFAWQDARVALEIDGGHQTGGRHVRPQGFEKDCEKMSLAAINGWRVLRATGRHVRTGVALQWVEAALAHRS